jgi:hypothetical protein
MFPTPANVSLEGAPKLSGWGEGAGLHESLAEQGGELAGAAGKHGDEAEHTRASYRSSA